MFKRKILESGLFRMDSLEICGTSDNNSKTAGFVKLAKQSKGRNCVESWHRKLDMHNIKKIRQIHVRKIWS